MVRQSISKTRIWVAAVVLGVFAFQGACAAGIHKKPNQKSTKQIVESMEEQWRAAQLAGDVSAMDKLLSDDFVGITAFGKVTTKAQQLDRIRNRIIVLTRLDLTDSKIKIIGNHVAVVTTSAEVTGTNEGKSIEGTFRYTRVYQKLPSGVWKITSFEATRADGQRARAEEAAPTPAATPKI